MKVSMNLLKLLKLGDTKEQLDLLIVEFRELVTLVKPVVVKVHRIVDIILEEDDEA